MKRFSLLTVAVLLLCFVNVSLADRVVMLEGKGRPVTGSIILITPEKVTVAVGSNTQEIPANAIAATTFDGEPAQLTTARNFVTNSRMQEAIDALEKVDPNTLTKDGMKQDYAYLLAYAKAKLVSTGGGDTADADKALSDFIKNFDKNSYHYYEICEVYGDLMVQLGRFDDAKKSYAILTKAPWPEYSLKATVSLGMAEVSEGKADDARKNFDMVIASTDDSPQAERQKSIARIGLALCLVAEKKFDEAIKALEEIAREAGSEDSSFQALVYNSLGSAYDQADKPRDAVLAYMHTDILFSAARSEHIKALMELSKLWRKIQRVDRAEEVVGRLKEQYNVTVR